MDPRKSGKTFERLVHLLEMLAAANCRVEFDAHPIDRTTGEPRQVDVAVWMQSHHGELLYAIQCKDEARRIDVGVIEQEAQKGQDIKAEKVAIVSSVGFTKSAQRKAAFLNIDLLTVKEAERNAWPSWMENSKFVLDVFKTNVQGASIVQIGQQHPPSASSQDRILVDPQGQRVEPLGLWLNLQNNGKDAAMQAMASVERHQTARVEIRFDPPWQMLNANGDLLVEKAGAAILEVEFWREKRELPAKLMDYREPGNSTSLIQAFVSDPYEMGGKFYRAAFTLRAEGDRWRIQVIHRPELPGASYD